MSLSVAVIALAAGVLVWVLLATRLTAKPWEAPAPREGMGSSDPVGVPAAKIGLWILLAVITSLFGLFLSAYYMRMEHAHGDWSSFPMPRVLFLNTGLLAASSAGMQWARAAARQAHRDSARIGFVVAGVLACAFLAGQLLAWRQLALAGYFLASGPAIAFFYVLTGIHGLHLSGGLLVWGKTAVRIAQPAVELVDLRLSLELCTVYWHYLLAVWLVVFAVLLTT